MLFKKVVNANIGWDYLYSQVY